MINVINDNFNDLAKDYYELQEDYEKQSKEIKKLKKEKSILEKSLKLIWRKDIKINYEELDKANKIVEKEVGLE